MRAKPISDLRRRMLADMTIRSFSDKTKNDDIRHVEALALFLGRSPIPRPPMISGASNCIRPNGVHSRPR